MDLETHGGEVCTCPWRLCGCLYHLREKKGDAIRLGADEIIVSTDAAQMKRHNSSFDLLHDLLILLIH